MEKFESFNKFIRAAAIHSNRQAPSRDIAIEFARGYHLNHILSGGFWKAESGEWVQASENVRRILGESDVGGHLKKAMGVREEVPINPRMLDKKLGNESASAQQLIIKQKLNDWGVGRDGNDMFDVWTQAKVSKEVKDRKWVQNGSFVVFYDDVNNPEFARISKIITPTGAKRECTEILLIANRCALKQKQDGSGFVRSADNECPILVENTDEFIILQSTDIVSAVNAQHICDNACIASRRRVKQEREDSNVEEDYTKHGTGREYCLNIYALLMPKAITDLIEIHGIPVESHVDATDKSKVRRFCERRNELWRNSDAAPGSQHTAVSEG
jgi:hypothetical protein